MGNARRQVSIFINGREVEGTVKGIRAELAKATNELSRMTIGSAEYERKMADWKKLNGVLDDHNQKLRGVKSGLDANKIGLQSLVGLAAGAFTVDAVISFGTELFNTGVQVQALERKYKQVFGATLPQVTAEAEKHAKAMGLTTHEYLAQAAAAQDLLVPLGFTRQEASKISVQLTNVSGALSEWTGGAKSAAEVGEILNSALLGEREALKGLGIDLQQADIDAALAARGLSNLTGEAGKQAEALVTLDLVMQKSTDAQDAFATGQGSLVRQSSELRARFTELKEDLSSALIPVFNELLKVANDTGDAFANLADGQLTDAAGNFLDVYRKFDVGLKLLDATGLTGGDKPAAPKPADPATNFDDSAARGQYEADFALQQQQNERLLQEQAKQDAKEKAEKSKKKAQAKAEREAEKQAEEAAQRAQDQAEAEREARLYAERYNAAKDGFARVNAIVGEASAMNQARIASDQETELALHNEKNRSKLNSDLNYQKEKDAAETAVTLATTSEYDLQVQEIEAHYGILIEMAKSYGISTVALEKKRSEELDALQKARRENQNKETQQTEAERLAIMQQSYANLGDLVTATFDLLGGEGEKYADFQKGATLAKIAFDTAAAISSLTAASNANPANAFTFGTAGFVQFTTGLARIIANIAQAKKLLTSAPKVTQKYEGSYLSVTGATDGRRYRAKSTTAPNTGMLPHYPVVFTSTATGAPVLASERGAEYFVASHDLTNPRVAHHVGMIENITRGRVAQFAEGGANPAGAVAPAGGVNPAGTVPPSGGADSMLMQRLLSVLDRIDATLAGGIMAVVPDATVVGINDRFKKIDAISGGYYSGG